MLLQSRAARLYQKRDMLGLLFGRAPGSFNHSLVRANVVAKYLQVVARTNPHAHNELDQLAFAKIIVVVTEIDEALALLAKSLEHVLIYRLAAEVDHICTGRIEKLVALLVQHVLVGQVDHRPAETLVE